MPVLNINQVDELPEHCILVIPEVAEDRIPAVEVLPNRWPKDMLPRTFRLVMKGGGETGGFRLWDPRKKTRFDQDRLGREAPPDGYVREITFDSDTLKSTREFFISINGKYGRGVIGAKSTAIDRSFTTVNDLEVRGFDFSKDGRAAEVSIAIALQPDGSRNLETPPRKISRFDLPLPESPVESFRAYVSSFEPR